uniref:Protein kinase domain-containing protein n=1 Tax=Heterorhabditis bacteriophora TaxID=37862 RepID=A0A1I7WN72_HETBA
MMGVSWVFEHDKSAKEVERQLEGGGAEQCGTYSVDCLPYIPNDKVEYEPSQVASQCALMITEMMQMFFPQHAANKPEVLTKMTPEPYTALDTLYQYLMIFKQMRKKA